MKDPETDYGVVCQVFFGIVLILAGFGIIGYQTLDFLHDGAWQPISIIDVAKLFFDEPWLRRPTSWYGLHWLLDWIPAAAACFFFGTTTILSS
ncbi:hypothetical protein GFB56_12405 [Ensifer sp. T173]|uniref:Uncharacterized protein n=1 Tax=Ensifer canadensis TaxID=555315 RepID=A0AAW4FKW9_9HYPH|nr:hypothetical protein [Ensifer canadensis]MBM3091616.1 hypothetical protein [Ensifer canadensis]UBI74399.1 hypothetical protein J3R84_12955 [Ensifer canadensis]